eukprot:Hpha_TRINITY_DN14862_c0_g1::TRINITY_DN14862_c0_g1_i1::g.170407::m.170407
MMLGVILALSGLAGDRLSYYGGPPVDLGSVADSLLLELAPGSFVQKVVDESPVARLVVFALNETLPCHYHHASVQLKLLRGQYFFQTPESQYTLLSPGDNFFTPALHPHAEGSVGGPAVALATWFPLPPTNNTVHVPAEQCGKGGTPAPITHAQ